MSLFDYVVTDDLTILLGLIGVSLFLLENLYKPQPLVHPILLGRQSDAARVRNPGESAVYRNYSTGIMGRFPLRPNQDTHSLLDLVKPESDSSRTLWSTKITNTELRERVRRAASGFLRIGKFVPEESNVLLLLNDGLEFLISDLALASQSIPSFTVSSLSLLSTVLLNHPPSVIVVDADFLPDLLELIYDSHEHGHHTVVVVGDLSGHKNLGKISSHVNLVSFSDIEKEDPGSQITLPTKIDPNTVFTVAFSESSSGQLQAVQLTHQHLTAGVAATRALVPVSNAISSLDTIVSAHSLSTPYGRAVAYTALFEGTSFATLQSTKLFPTEEAAFSHGLNGLKDFNSVKSSAIPSPTLLFVKPLHLTAITSSILDEAQRSFFLYALGWRHKMAGATQGFMTKESLWDRLVFDNARIKVLGEGAGTLRGVIVAGGSLEASALTPARIALSVPLVNALNHPLVAGPVMASHPLDLQILPTQIGGDEFSTVAPVGPPTVNVEVKLSSVNDAMVKDGGDPVGTMSVRGPSVGQVLGRDNGTTSDEPEGEWVETGLTAKVLSNGTFKISYSTTE